MKTRVVAACSVLVAVVCRSIPAAASGESDVGDLERACEAKTELGPRDQAVAACGLALKVGNTTRDERDMVAALMSGRERPSVEDLAQALTLARDARSRAPSEPWGYVALCDIAERIGDAGMLQDCSENLERTAPGLKETRRALAAAASLNLTWYQRVAWLTIAIAAIGTAAHALWRGVWRVRLSKRAAAAVVGALASLVAPSLARAAEAPEAKGDVSAWKIDDDDPEKSIPSDEQRNRDPIQFGYWLQDLTARAAGSAKRGDHETAIKYYKTMAKAVPDRSIAFAKLCDEYDALHDRAKAVEACGLALFREGVTTKDYIHYANLVLTVPGVLTDVQVKPLMAVIKHLREDSSQAALADELECETGIRARDTSKLEECTKGMAARAPDDPKTLVYEWNLAMAQQNYDAARDVIAHAKKVPAMKPEAIEKIEAETDAIQGDDKRIDWLVGGIVFVLAIAGAIGGWIWMKRRQRPIDAPETETAPVA